MVTVSTADPLAAYAASWRRTTRVMNGVGGRIGDAGRRAQHHLCVSDQRQRHRAQLAAQGFGWPAQVAAKFVSRLSYMSLRVLCEGLWRLIGEVPRRPAAEAALTPPRGNEGPGPHPDGWLGYQPDAVPTHPRAIVCTLVAAPGAPARRPAAAA